MSEPHSLCAYNDCAIPRHCACIKRGYPFKNPDRETCLVPAIKALTEEIGRPYIDEIR